MKEIKRDNAIINYNIKGRGDTTLLLIHGSCIDQTYWKQQVNYFSSNYKVVTFDLPGHGKVGKERKHWTTQGFAEDVITVIRELDLKNIILIGHSWGGDINLIAATSYSEPIIGLLPLTFLKMRPRLYHRNINSKQFPLSKNSEPILRIPMNNMPVWHC